MEAQRTRRQAAAVLEEYRTSHGITDPDRPLGDTLETPDGRALLRRLDWLRTDHDGTDLSWEAGAEVKAALVRIRGDDARARQRLAAEVTAHQQASIDGHDAHDFGVAREAHKGWHVFACAVDESSASVPVQTRGRASP